MKFITKYFLLLSIPLIGCQEKTKLEDEKKGFIEINNTKHYYNILGKGDTLVVLHGGPGFSHQYLKPQLDALLSSDFTLLYYDQRGSGWSEGIEDTLKLNIQTYISDLDQIKNHFNLSRLNLVGHSFGGLLGMYYGISFPENVNSLVLIDTDAASYKLRTPYQIKTINSRLTENQNRFLDSIEGTEKFKNYNVDSYISYYKSYLATYFANPSDTSKLTLGFDSINIPKINTTNRIVRANLGEYDIHEQLAKIQCPTLILHGTKSVFSIDGAQAIHNKLTNSALHLFENCGHFEYIESPVKFKKSIIDFYKKY